MRIAGDRTLLFLPGELNHGNLHIRAHSLQEIRGLAQNWITAGLFWRALRRITDVLLSYDAEFGAYVSCGNVEVWHGVWNMLSFIRTISVTPDMWGDYSVHLWADCCLWRKD